MQNKAIIPDSWEVYSFGDCCTELYRYPTYYNIDYVEDGVPEIRPELIKENGVLNLDRALFRYVSENTASAFPRVRLKTGDFVMSVRGTMGKVAVIPETLEGAVITANLIRMQFNKALIEPGWARHLLSSDLFQNCLVSVSSATTISTIQVPRLRSITITAPPVFEQRRIAEILDAADEAIRKTDELIAKLKMVKRGLLHDLLTRGVDEEGRLRESSNVGKWLVKKLGDCAFVTKLAGFEYTKYFDYYKSGSDLTPKNWSSWYVTI